MDPEAEPVTGGPPTSKYDRRSSRYGERVAAVLALYPAAHFAWWIDLRMVESCPPEITRRGQAYMRSHGGVLPDPMQQRPPFSWPTLPPVPSLVSP
jgi:hypothetical protein